MANNFEVPSWAGKPPTGLHFDVTKDGKLVQKLMIDEKKCYFFGRNRQLCDFCIDHQSCSRIHSALVWHRHLNRPFLIDLGSTHGTFIGTIRLERNKPQQVPIDSELHFGASTRLYIIRERPQMPVPSSGDGNKLNEEIEGGLLGLPETETELDNLTEFNTAHNRRPTQITDSVAKVKRKRKSTHVAFNEEDDVINPEDVDPSIGRFRNMVSTTVIPKKRMKTDSGELGPTLTESITKRLHNFAYEGLYHNVPHGEAEEHTSPTGSETFSFASKLGLGMPNLAPNLEDAQQMEQIQLARPTVHIQAEESKEPRKKKYAKEAWPGKRPTHSLLV